MFLTRFQFNPRRRGAQKLISSPHALHAAVQSGFPDPQPTEAGRVLWRLDIDDPQALLYVASPQQPDFTHLAEQAGWPSLVTWESRSYSPLLERLTAGQRWRFRLTANPVHGVRAEGQRGRGKPVGHVTVAQQEKWLRDRQQAAGFEIVGDDRASTLNVVGRRMLRFQRKGVDVTLSLATYEGVLVVGDQDRFRHTLTHGLGRAKGYGCGLLTLAPVG